MTMTKKIRSYAMGSGFIATALIVGVWSPNSYTIKDAEARFGRPMTPVSVAGVAPPYDAAHYSPDSHLCVHTAAGLHDGLYRWGVAAPVRRNLLPNPTATSTWSYTSTEATYGGYWSRAGETVTLQSLSGAKTGTPGCEGMIAASINLPFTRRLANDSSWPVADGQQGAVRPTCSRPVFFGPALTGTTAFR